MNHPNYEYLELACYGMSYAEVAKQYRKSVESVRCATLRAARIVGRQGFWKFDVPNRDVLDLMRRQILDRMDENGLRAQCKEAA